VSRPERRRTAALPEAQSRENAGYEISLYIPLEFYDAKGEKLFS
jgi:hypothetical protein